MWLKVLLGIAIVAACVYEIVSLIFAIRRRVKDKKAQKESSASDSDKSNKEV